MKIESIRPHKKRKCEMLYLTDATFSVIPQREYQNPEAMDGWMDGCVTSLGPARRGWAFLEITLEIAVRRNYGGYAVNLAPGRYDLGQLQAMGMRNDDISAIRVAPSFTVKLYEHAGFRGRILERRHNDDCFVNDNFNDIVSSVEVSAAP